MKRLKFIRQIDSTGLHSGCYFRFPLGKITYQVVDVYNHNSEMKKIYYKKAFDYSIQTIEQSYKKYIYDDSIFLLYA